MWDRIADSYLHTSMQKIVGDRLRPDGAKDPQGVADARKTIKTACDQMEARLGQAQFLGGDTISMADCAAAPPLFYLQAIAPYAETHPRLARYFETLENRPSHQRMLSEAKPFLLYFPFVDQLPKRYLA